MLAGPAGFLPMDAPHNRSPERLCPPLLEPRRAPNYAVEMIERRGAPALRAERSTLPPPAGAAWSASDEPVLCPERWAIEALLALWEANRAEGEAYSDCFARLGVPRYAMLLDQVTNSAA